MGGFLRSSIRKRSSAKRILRHEQLDQRALLAADLGFVEISTSPWQNSKEPVDVSGDGFLSALDALSVINAINSGGDLTAPPMLEGRSAEADEFVDVSGDRFISAVDALMVINELNAEGSGVLGVPDFAGLEDRHGDRLGEATQLQLTTGYAFGDGVIGDGSDVDMFSFVASKDGRIGVGVGSFSGDLALTAYDADQNVVGSSQGAEGFLDLTASEGDTYFVAVSKIDSTDDLAVPYVLDIFEYNASVYVGPAAEEGDQHGDTAESATELELVDGSAFVQSEINSEGDVDVFQVSAVEGILSAYGYFVDSIGSQLNITVTDADGVDLQPREDGLGYDVAAGDYTIAVTGKTGAYVLDVYSYSTVPWLNDLANVELTADGYFSQPAGFLKIGDFSAPGELELIYLDTDGTGKLLSAAGEQDVAYTVSENGDGYSVEVSVANDEKLVLSLEKLYGDGTDKAGATWFRASAIFV